MRARTRLGVALLALGALAGGWLALRGGGAGRGERARAAAEPLAFAWQTGQRYVYALHYDATSRVQVPASEGEASLEGHTAIDAELWLSAYQQRGDRHLLGVRLAAPQRLHIDVLGTAAYPSVAETEAALVGPEALLEITAEGDVVGLRFGSADPVFQNLMQMLVADSQVRLADGRQLAWEADEAGPIGVARTRYQRRGHSVVKTRGGYQRLNGLAWQRDPAALDQSVVQGATATLAPGGWLSALKGRERVVAQSEGRVVLAQTSDIDLALLRIEPLGGDLAPALLAQAEVPLGAMTDDPRALHNALEGAVQDFGWTELERFVLDFDGVPGEDHLERMRKAFYLLELHPELASELVALFADARLSRGARFLVLDVLAGAGHSQAQAALRELLRRPELAGADYVPAIQRLSALGHPERATGEFVASEVERTTGDAHSAALYTLGSVAGRLSSDGDALGDHLNERLVGDLLRSEDAREQRMLLGALHNTARADNLPVLRTFTGAVEPLVRAQATRAIGRIAGPEAQATLVAMTRDESPAVQNVALSALAGRPVAGTAEALAQAVLDGQVAPTNYHSVLTILVPGLPAGALRTAVFTHMLEHAPPDPNLASELRSLLAA